MAKRNWASTWLRSVQRAVGVATRDSLKAGARTAAQVARRASRAVPAAAPGRVAARPARPPADRAARAAAVDDWIAGIAMAPAAGARRYRLYRPPAAHPTAATAAPVGRLPLLVMLHGCTQDAGGFAQSTRMNRIAAREGFFVLYPEQDRHAHPQGCWNWYATRTGQAQGEAAIVAAAVEQVCRLYPIDRDRVALAGLSAGASLAALIAARQPARYRALVMHSGLAPGCAHSTASALAAMQGRRAPDPVALVAALGSFPADALLSGDAQAGHAAGGGSGPCVGPDNSHAEPRDDAAAARLPPLLVIHGAADRTVVPSNGRAAAAAWAAVLGARAGLPRLLRRGQRHPAQVTDFKRAGRTLVSLCEIEHLGHAWSGGDARQPFGDAAGPDASRLAWAFVARNLTAAARPAPRWP